MKTTEIDGLVWNDNFCAETGSASYTLVANPGPLVTDFQYWNRDSYEAYIAHLGQDNRFTFLGDPSSVISGHFVDCRAKSHGSTVQLTFSPNAESYLTIPRGVASFFTGMQGVTVRSEPILFAPSQPDSDYSVGNDQIRMSTATKPADFPHLIVNDLPLPDGVLNLINARQQEILRTKQSYESSFGVPVGDTIVRINGSRG